mmetsp:Transcript_10396/g.32894  ORF Transcript_10396/g.32894 Transcript_10396/m.32894 type:complete len:213 (-) Transcript_10396:550-1188(-)
MVDDGTCCCVQQGEVDSASLEEAQLAREQLVGREHVHGQANRARLATNNRRLDGSDEVQHDVVLVVFVSVASRVLQHVRAEQREPVLPRKVNEAGVRARRDDPLVAGRPRLAGVARRCLQRRIPFPVKVCRRRRVLRHGEPLLRAPIHLVVAEQGPVLHDGEGRVRISHTVRLREQLKVRVGRVACGVDSCSDDDEAGIVERRANGSACQLV